MERRLNRLEMIWQRRAELVNAEPAFDVSRLSAEEQAEFEEIVAHGRAHATFTDRYGVKALGDEELERLSQLGDIAQGLDPRPG
jgi:hypothetical protein